MSQRRLYDILSSLLKIEVTTIQRNLAMNQIETWDSLAAIGLIIELENAFGIKLKLADFERFYSIGDIEDLLHQHGVRIWD